MGFYMKSVSAYTCDIQLVLLFVFIGDGIDVGRIKRALRFPGSV